MTAEQNLEVVRRAYEAVARGDFEGALEAFDPSVVVEDRRGSASGVQVSEQQFHVFDFAHDRVVRFRAFVDREQALRAAG